MRGAGFKVQGLSVQWSSSRVEGSKYEALSLAVRFRV